VSPRREIENDSNCVPGKTGKYEHRRGSDRGGQFRILDGIERTRHGGRMNTVQSGVNRAPDDDYTDQCRPGFYGERKIYSPGARCSYQQPSVDKQYQAKQEQIRKQSKQIFPGSQEDESFRYHGTSVACASAE